jgi:hypothetical protein
MEMGGSSGRECSVTIRPGYWNKLFGVKRIERTLDGLDSATSTLILDMINYRTSPGTPY